MYVSPVANWVVFVHTLGLNLLHGIILKIASYHIRSMYCMWDSLLSASAAVCMYSCKCNAACHCICGTTWLSCTDNMYLYCSCIWCACTKWIHRICPEQSVCLEHSLHAIVACVHATHAGWPSYGANAWHSLLLPPSCISLHWKCPRPNKRDWLQHTGNHELLWANDSVLSVGIHLCGGQSLCDNSYSSPSSATVHCGWPPLWVWKE